MAPSPAWNSTITPAGGVAEQTANGELTVTKTGKLQQSPHKRQKNSTLQPTSTCVH